MKIKLIVLPIFVFLFFCGIVTAEVEVVFSDDFEGVPGVEWPDANADADPFAQTGRWATKTETNITDIQVSNNAVPGASSGDNFLTVHRSATIDLNGEFASPVADSSLMTVDFDIYFSSACPDGEGANVAVREGSALNTLDVFLYSSAYNGFRLVNNGTYLTPYSEGFAADQWHHVNFVIDLAADTYDITISGVTYSDRPLRTATNKVDHLWFSGNSADSYFFLDNIEVAGTIVPPPPFGPEMAGKVFVDDFENVTAVSWPDTTNNADPSAQIGSWGELTAIDSTGTFLPAAIQVTDNAVPGPATADSSNYLVFERENYSFMVASWVQELDASDEPIIIEFDCYLPYTSEGYQGLTLGVQESTTYTAIDYAILNTYLHNINFGGFRVLNSGTTYLTPPGSAFGPNQWHHVRYDIYLSTDTYDLRIDNTIYEDAPFAKSVDSIGHIFLGGYNAGSLYYLDNISIGTQSSVCLSAIKADLTDDCQVNLDDLVVLSDAWLFNNNY